MQSFIKVKQIMQKQKVLKFFFNKLRNKFSKSKIMEIRKKLYKKEKGLENEEQEKNNTPKN